MSQSPLAQEFTPWRFVSGAPLIFSWLFQDDQTGEPEDLGDLSEVTGRLKRRTRPGETEAEAVAFTLTGGYIVVDADTGQIDWTVDETASAALAAGIYDLQLDFEREGLPEPTVLRGTLELLETL